MSYCKPLASLLLTLLLTSCASYIDYGNGRYGVIKDAQEPVAFGVSNSFAVLENCEGTQREGYRYEKLDFTDCHPMTAMTHASAPGYFPSVFTGLMNLAGFGWVATAQTGGSVNANASSSSISNAASSASGGSKGGHH